MNSSRHLPIVLFALTASSATVSARPTINASALTAGGLVQPGAAILIIGQPFTGSTPQGAFGVVPLLAPPACVGDTNGDNAVNGADLSVLLSQFGTSVPSGTGADFNGDAQVNGADLSVLLGRFGTSCN